MKRRLFTILSALSLLLFVAVCVLWVRSYFHHDMAAFRRSTPPMPDGRFALAEWGLSSHAGVIYFNHSTGLFPAKNYRPEYDGFHFSSLTADPSRPFDSGLTVRWRLGRLAWLVAAHAMWPRVRFLTMPAWVLATLFGVAPVYVVFRWLSRRRGEREGHCPACGYDLRATPGRCPECGLVPAAVPPPPSA